jgi:hypothetical protein
MADSGTALPPGLGFRADPARGTKVPVPSERGPEDFTRFPERTAVHSLLDPLSTSIPPHRRGGRARRREGSAPDSALGVVVLCVSPLAPARHVLEAATASLLAGNRTLVSFPAGVTHRTHTTVATLAARVGTDRLAIVTGRDLADDLDAELGHLVSVDASTTARAGITPVRHESGHPAERRRALTTMFSDTFPLAEWSSRVGTGW